MGIARFFAVGVASLLFLTSTALAQDGPGGFLYVVQADVKPGMAPQYADFLKKINEAATDSPDVVLVFQRAMGGSVNTFYIAIPFTQWGEIDSWVGPPQILARAFGEDEAMKLMEGGGAMLDSLSVQVSRTVPEFTSGSGNPPSGPFASLAHVILTEIDPDLAPQYDRFLRRLKAAEEQAGVSQIRRVTMEGPLALYTTVRLFNTHAERDSWKGPFELITEAFGEEAAEVLGASQAEAVRSREAYVLRFRPDLSRRPATSSGQ